MITIGSISRSAAAEKFPFLGEHFSGRRTAIKDFTHLAPDFVFWIYPDGELLDARDAHRSNPPKGYEHILRDEPDYGGFLRGRLASNHGDQLIVIYCRPEALASEASKMAQFLDGISQLPVPHAGNALVISDNGDIYGLVTDIERRLEQAEQQDEGGGSGVSRALT
ncbi:MAG: hypothetical protein V4726_19530 [Verrucomicrobiota bacterium]